MPAKKKATKKEKKAAKVDHFVIVQLAAGGGEPKIWGFDGRLNKVRNKPDRIVTGSIRGKAEMPAGSSTAPKGTFMIVGPIRPTARKPKAMKMDGWLYPVEGKKAWTVSAVPLGGRKSSSVAASPPKKAAKAKKEMR